MSAIINKLEQLLKPSVEALGFDIWAIDLVNVGQRKVLRVFVDGKDGVNSDDCGRISRQIAAVMDVEDPIKSAYVLEVSSPGLDRCLRTLAHYQRYLGHEIKIKLTTAVDHKRTFKGALESIDDDNLVLLTPDGTLTFARNTVEKANVVPSF